jgi:CRISPR/Cas system-associated exonuclease Cas4 (RecB family)
MGQDLSDTLLIVPNRKVSDYFLRYNPAINHIKSIEGLSNAIIKAFYPHLGYSTHPIPVTAQQQKLILLDVTQKSVPNITAKSSYLQEIYDLIHRIDECGIDSDKLIRLSDKLNRQRFRDIIAIIEDYRAELKNQNKVDYPKMISLAIELLENKLSRSDIINLFPVSEIIVSDLHTVSPLGARLIDTLAQLMAVPLSAYSSQTEDFWTFRGADKGISHSIPVTEILHNTDYRPQEKLAATRQYRFNNYEDEALYAALKAASLVYDDKVSPSSIVISYRNIRQSSATIVKDYLRQLNIPANIVTPTTNFYNHPMVSHILHLIMLADGSEAVLGNYFRSPVTVLCGDIVGMDMSQIHTLTDTGVFPSDPKDLVSLINNELPPETPYVIKLNDTIKLIKGHIERKEGLLAILQGLYNKYSIELDGDLYRELLIRADDFLRHKPEINPENEVVEFIKFTQDARFTDDILGLAGENPDTIRIVPFHEVILSHYPHRVEHLFALDMSEGAIPMEYNQSELAQPRIFLHVDEILDNKYNNVDMAFDALLEEKKLFNILAQNTDNLYLSYSRITAGSNDTIPSRFLAPDYDEPEQLGHIYDLLEGKKARKAKPKYEMDIERYSASLISTYIQCPYKAYMDRCNVNRSISLASLKGLLVHRIISDSIQNSQPIDIDAIDVYWVMDYLSGIEEDDYDYYVKFWDGYNLHDKEITISEMTGILKAWLEFCANKKIVDSEKSIGFKYYAEGGVVDCIARLDGVVLNNDGSRTIFDIKTGSNNKKDPLYVQIYLYAYGYAQVFPSSKLSGFDILGADGVSEYSITGGEGDIQILKHSSRGKSTDIIPEARENVESAIKGMQSNNWEPKKSKQVCDYCDYKSVCPAWIGNGDWFDADEG